VTPEDLAALRAFLARAGALKDTLRSGFTQGGRREDAAAHSWRVALLALSLSEARPDLNPARVLALALVHDLPEAVVGDAPAIEGPDPAAKSAAERAGLGDLLADAPVALAARLSALWEEYEAAATPEARWVKALDKIETLMTHAEGANPPGFDYAFNLRYGRAATDAEPLAAALRALLDAETAAQAAAAADLRPPRS
jgi:putative hydrolase of HD superfamily